MSTFVVVDSETWDRILKKMGRNNVELRDARYDHIIHLVRDL
jgi:hypothetical protein